MKRLALLVLIVAVMVTLIPTAAQAKPTEGQQCRTIHIVKRGQTLSMIAARYGVSTKTLQNANNIRNRNVIYVGQRICIPGQKPAPHPPPPPKPSHPYPPPACGGNHPQPCPPPHPYPPPPTCGEYPQHPCPPPGYYPPPPGGGAYPPPPNYSCDITPVNGFGRVWYNNPHVRQRLGCPTAVESGFPAIDQPFVSGHVIEDTGSKIIYTFFSRGSFWAQQPDTWQEGEPVADPYLIPPYGCYQPTYGIGKMWRSVDNYMQRLGWAKRPAYPVNATRQTFANGTMIWTSNGGIRVLYNDGTFQRFQ